MDSNFILIYDQCNKVQLVNNNLTSDFKKSNGTLDSESLL